MARTALAMMLSFVLIMFATPQALAKTNSKQVAKKAAVAKAPAAKRPAASAKQPAKQAAKQAARPAGRVIGKARGRVAPLVAEERLVPKVVRGRRGRQLVYQRVAPMPALPVVPPVMTAGDLAGLNLTRDPLDLKSNAALVLDQSTAEVLFEKNSQVALPIASITKLMTSLVVVEANQNMDELISVTNEDIDREKFSHSRLRVGSQLTRTNMLHIALMSSENRAASALGRSYPGGLPAFVAAMNAKARALGMVNTHYVDSTGLSSNNVSTARDLAKLVVAAHQHPLIRQYSTDSKYAVEPGGPMLQYRNSNHLVDNPDWQIGLQKTGYISEAGRCLVMQTQIEGRPIVMVFLDSKGKTSRLADAGRIRKWLENVRPTALSRAITAQSS
ncbi:D-alanyl-D-alanine endopeptidase [Noviherbaspirillum suwonense]|jgi:D-alanyl-D-alanine endopeptidase (penicillin-binding protein 7)|uniref:D-alanyl-D-alanine endopeptidase (Penicillin-binding protein 7) n=1 Tax=Noviherbaspirillum suwonense TaxID=1224511 RepID=A0ABY1QT44_9BURK|nr:D-alanyl-D-alanine endopeptidase (penicillin-binding protein 7) [Noviherbaspirillum suwonense]